MLTAISRYGARVLPNTQQVVAGCASRGRLVDGPAIEEFEQAFSQRHGGLAAISTSCGRMAFYYILRAMNLAPGSEVIFPALTFWVVPEMARVLGLKPVFADVNPDTFNLEPEAVEKSLTPRTRAIVATHLYGLPCDMDQILAIARRHGLAVIEDCAHALGALYRGQPAGTLGDAAFFSFQLLKPLNTYGGGMALVRDAALGEAVRALARREPWPSEAEVRRRLLIGRVQRILIRPSVFRWTLFPVLWAASWTDGRPDVYLWEKIRPLDPLPEAYRRRFSNVQAALGLEGLRRLDAWTAATQRNAALLTRELSSTPGVRVPSYPPDRTHVFYQYCVYVADRERVVRSAVRRGLDLETLHVDVCTRLTLFRASRVSALGADRAAEAVQLPVYASLSEDQIRWVARTLKQVIAARAAATASIIQSALH